MRQHAAGMRVHRHDGAVDFRHLAQADIRPACRRRHRLDIEDVARLDDILRRWPARAPDRRPAIRAAPICSLHRACVPVLPSAKPMLDVLAVITQRHRQRQVSMPDWFGIVPAWRAPSSSRREIDMLLGAAPAMAAVIAHQPGAQRADGIVLQPRVQRGAHLQAAVVKRLAAILLDRAGGALPRHNNPRRRPGCPGRGSG